MIIENSLTIHNHEPTFFRKNIHSCIDHIISNCPLNISNVQTYVNTNDINYINTSANIINNTNPIMSDHALLTCNYNHKDIVIPQQFKVIRDYKLLRKHNLQQYFIHNSHINSVFNETDPYIIANTIINELSIIIECIAPTKKIECR